MSEKTQRGLRALHDPEEQTINFYTCSDCIDECRNLSVAVTCDPTPDTVVMEPGAVAKLLKSCTLTRWYFYSF